MDALQIKLTNACQYNCFYCRQRHQQLLQPSLTREETLTICRLAVAEGIHRFELVGGEPLLYEGVVRLVADMKALDGVEWVSITTNGILLDAVLPELIAAGLDGINLHLDTTAVQDYRQSTGVQSHLNEILNGLWHTVARDFPITVTVALHQHSAAQIPVMAGLAKRMALTVRFADIGMPSRGMDAAYLQQQLRPVCGKLELAEGAVCRPEGWKGSICCGRSIAGAFGMERAVCVGCTD